MAGTWVRSGTIALTSGSKKVTGTGTAWNSGLNKVTKGCALKHNNIDYEVDYVNSDTELYLVDTYTAATLSGQAYRIQVTVTDTIPELSSRIAQALAYWNSQGANLQALVTGNGNVTLTSPDGTQVTIPSYSNMQPKDALLTALAALTTAADKLVYFTGADTVDQTPLTSFARTLLDDIDAATARGTLGAQASDSTLTALAGVVTAADKLIYATGVDTFSTATLTAFARTVLAGTDAAAILTTLGASKATIAETVTRIATDRVITPAGLNAVVPYAPTVNPTLDLDFAKQKYKWYAGAAGLTESSTPSLMTFTRSSIATYFDAMGVMQQASANTPRIDYDPLTGECKGLLVEEQRTNLLTYSSRFDNADWIKLNALILPSTVVAPDGTLTAQKLIPNTTSASGHAVSKSISATGVTHSVIAKAGEYSKLMLWFSGLGSGYGFDLSSGSTFAISGVASTGLTASIAYIGNGFYRCSIYTASSITSCDSFVLQSTAFSAYAGDGVSGLYIWADQLEVGAFPTTYIPSADTWTARASTATYLDSNGVLQTAASGVARSAAYDYDADGVLRPIGLLLEGAATNLLLYSEQFDNAAWTKSGATIIANASSAPNGTATADKLVEDSSTGNHRVYQSVTAAASTAYVYSVYAKPAERTRITLSLYDGTTTLTATFNLSTASITSVDTGASASILKSANGAYRCSIKATSGASATSTLGAIYLHNGTSSSYTGDGISGVYVWGAQLAAGNYATSYIATTSAQGTRVADTSTSAQATRAADYAVISGTNFSQWYKQYEGTLVGDFYNDVSSAFNDTSGGSRSVAALSGSSNSDLIRFAAQAGVGSIINKNDVNQSAQQVGVWTALGKRKHALSYIVNQVNAATDGVIATTDASASIPYLTTMFLGLGTMTSGNFNSHIRRLQYFPKALTAAELKAMTA